MGISRDMDRPFVEIRLLRIAALACFKCVVNCLSSNTYINVVESAHWTQRGSEKKGKNHDRDAYLERHSIIRQQQRTNMDNFSAQTNYSQSYRSGRGIEQMHAGACCGLFT